MSRRIDDVSFEGGVTRNSKYKSTDSFLETLQSKGVKTGDTAFQATNKKLAPEDSKQEKSTKSTDKMFKSMKSAGGAIGKLGGFLGGLTIMEPIMEILGAFVEVLGAAFMPLIEKLSGVLLKALPYVMAFADGLSKFIEVLTSGAFWSEIGDKIKQFFLGIGDWFKEAWKSVKDWFLTHIIDPIRNFINGIRDVIVGVINAIIDGVNHVIPGKRWDINRISVTA